jgi:hypothetical protein
MSVITREDTSRHTPIEGDPHWQESFFLGWVDARNSCAGHHHISLCPHLKLAHVWTWLIVDGKEVARSQEHTLPLPDDDLRDMRLGVLHFVAGESIRSLHLSAGFEGATVDVDYEAYIDPTHVDINAGGLKLGSRHYESMGSVRGTITLGERTITVNGGGWQDHSWGSRRLSSNPAGRWIFAVFGEDLAFSLYSLAVAESTIIFGYVIDNGWIDPIEEARCGVVVGDDGISPESCDTTLWTKSGRGYRLTGSVAGTALVGGPGWSGDGNHFWMDGLARFECGGRIGSGIIEVSNLKAPTARQRAILRLD